MYADLCHAGKIGICLLKFQLLDACFSHWHRTGKKYSPVAVLYITCINNNFIVVSTRHSRLFVNDFTHDPYYCHWKVKKPRWWELNYEFLTSDYHLCFLPYALVFTYPNVLMWTSPSVAVLTRSENLYYLRCKGVIMVVILSPTPGLHMVVWQFNKKHK